MEGRRIELQSHRSTYEVGGVNYQLVSLGGSGWSIGLGSIIQAIDGQNIGKLYLANIGQRVDILRELSPEEAAEIQERNTFVRQGLG